MLTGTQTEMDIPGEFADHSFQYIIGIDLGTTNSALAYVDLASTDPAARSPRFLDIPQLIAAGELGRRAVLPSFLYLPGPYELPAGSTALPWDPRRNYAVGEFAREQGTLVPGRLVSSAKSWLCHGGVDRTNSILPWGAGPDVEKVSPIEAGSRYLRHIREAWNETKARGKEGHLLEEQLVVLTVPASFDEVARELTVRAAREAGIPKPVLIEEPLAAFYAWLSTHEADWHATMRPEQLVLVCDVGGGTSDFTIIAISEDDRGIRLDRLAVGEHLMLGGDNMDLALARHIEKQFAEKAGRLDSRRWHQLWHQCRKAKETLLAGSSDDPKPPDRDSVDITIVGSGGRLIAGTLKATLTGNEAEELILDGFFPHVCADESMEDVGRTELSEWGLPYVQDSAVTRHLLAFWRRNRDLLFRETGRSAPYPDFLLFNGGALIPASIRSRVREVVREWFAADAGDDWSPTELENPRPDLAVAVGAAYYGLVRLGKGIRVGAGSPRTYYAEVSPEKEREIEAGTLRAVCLVPRGADEGFETSLEKPEFQVLANQPVIFKILTSSTRLEDRLGEILTLPAHEVSVLPPIKTVLKYGKKGTAQSLPVRLAVTLTDIGTLELWCRSISTPHRWQLQFDVRHSAGDAGPAAAPGEIFDSNQIEEAQAAISAVFRRTEDPAAPAPERLVRNLVSILDLAKEKWPSSLIRKLADTLIENRDGRAITFLHEARWLNLLGFCLRPGFGDPVDEWRIKEVWKFYPPGLINPRQGQNRSEWWIFWRRVAGGLNAGQQMRIYQQVLPYLLPEDRRKKGTSRKGSRIQSAQEELEVWMMLANLERLPAAAKVDLGKLMLQRIVKGKPRSQELWAFGRFGARIPFYGPLDQVVPRKEVSGWLNALLALDPEAKDALAQALLLLSRLTGDRERDLDQTDRDRVLEWFERFSQPHHFRELLTNPQATLMSRERDWIFGESLPTGLMLLDTH